MSINSTSKVNEPRKNWGSHLWSIFIAPVWNFLTAPHASVQEIGEIRRAQLLASIALILIASLTWALFSNPTSFSTFIALYFTALISYVFSRSPYYRTGAYFFSYGITSLAFFSLYFGTATSFDGAITSIAHISLIIASILLSLRGFSLLVLISTIATFSAQSYSQTPIASEAGFFRVAGVFMSIGLVLIGANIFRARVESDRLREVQNANSELEEIKTNLEQHVEERTNELAAANEQTSRRATQLQTITELSESISLVEDL
ncbi:MAG TPA: hypothetical protein VKE92_17005, partial [Anaerolineales bacterium]|nr:hypothetical protein [Anaerolineales bacterium]